MTSTFHSFAATSASSTEVAWKKMSGSGLCVRAFAGEVRMYLIQR